jgi:uncharacterized membrane protein
VAFLKETQRSLHWYFIIAGMFSVLMGMSQLDDIGDVSELGVDIPASWMFSMYFSCAARLVLGVAYVVTGARLDKDLLKGGRATRVVLKIALAVILADIGLITTIVGFEATEPELGRTIVGVAITLYLLHNVTRLSTEAKDKAGIPPDPPQARALP